MSSNSYNPKIQSGTPECNPPEFYDKHERLDYGWKPPLPPQSYPSNLTPTHEWGSHKDGNYVAAYIPSNSSNIVVIYLHGFALGSPWFYQDHLYHLSQEKGYNAIFVDYQQDAFEGYTYPPASDCGNRIEDIEGLWDAAKDLVEGALDSLHITALQTVQNAINNALYALQQLELTPNGSKGDPEIYIFGHSVGGFLSLSWVYGLTQATIDGTGNPSVSLSQPPSSPNPSNGLTLTQDQQTLLMPKAIVAASPMTHTASLPDWIAKFLPQGDQPFLENSLDIATTGGVLGDADTPIAMLLGADDTLAPISSWQDTKSKDNGTEKINWDWIASTKKRMYISQRYAKSGDRYEPITTQSDCLEIPMGGNQLWAYHNQSVTNTIANACEGLQIEVIGGPGKMDAMRFNYIWSGLDQVIEGTDVTQLTFNMGEWTCAKKPEETVPVAPVTSWVSN
ncbi:MAG: hypothetical protein QNJ51_20325 [Calothrix sp. MO_167.B12]|nr:hypothetical protein [Calothrix sp. MO_167.B12]